MSATTSQDKNAKVMDAKKDANTEKREADYKAAAERCDSLSGATKDSCVTAAKTQFGMK